MKDVIIFKVKFLKACEFDYIVRCLKSKTRPLDFVLEVITKHTNFNKSYNCCKNLTFLNMVLSPTLNESFQGKEKSVLCEQVPYLHKYSTDFTVC